MAFTKEEELYFIKNKAMNDKFFRPKEVRSPFKKVLDEIKLKMHEN